LTELQTRGVKDILIACVDGLKGFPDAIQAVFPQTQIQLCIVHMIRNSVRYVPWKDYKAVTTDLKKVYQSATEEEGLQALEQLSQRWDSKYPQISKSWRAHWENINTFFKYPDDIRKAIYTTNAIESLNSVIRKVIKKRKLFPTDDSAKKVVFLAVQEASKKWTMPIRNWKLALNRFMIEFEDRLSCSRFELPQQIIQRIFTTRHSCIERYLSLHTVYLELFGNTLSRAPRIPSVITLTLGN